MSRTTTLLLSLSGIHHLRSYTPEAPANHRQGQKPAVATLLHGDLWRGHHALKLVLAGSGLVSGAGAGAIEAVAVPYADDGLVAVTALALGITRVTLAD